MKKYIIGLSLSAAPLLVMAQDTPRSIAEKEILQAEKDFSAMAQEKGVKQAFLFYAADEVVILRGRRMYQGKSGLEQFYGTASASDTLTWEPDFVSADSAGEMGYSYGKYIFRGKDQAGKPMKGEGYFHTIWRKQADGQWKFVCD